MKTVNLTSLKNELDSEELQEFTLGEIVEVEQGTGIIAAMADETIEFPTGEDDTQEIEASSDNPVYIVALMEGGSVAATADEISGDASIEGDGEEITSFEDIEKEAEETEMSVVYDYCDGDPHSRAVLEDAKRRYIHENYASELAKYVNEHEATLATLEEMDSEELVNIRGVDDPEVGFSSLPDGWTRKSVLQAWASLGGMWRTCYARMVREFGPNRARRWCAAMKDEVLGTERWRNRF